MVPKEQYGRVSGMLSTADFASSILAPVIAAILLGIIGIGGILTLDIITFLIAVGALLVVHIPKP